MPNPVENPPAVDLYTALKGCLVLAHQLMPMQVVAGSNQRPSEVLASLLEFCPPGEEGTAFFRAAFTMRLLVAIQAHLAVASTELTHLKELMHRRSWPMADPLWLCHSPQLVAALFVEADQSEEDSGEVLAAIPSRR